MLPPFLWRSHRILRRSACGNICCILSTANSLALRIASGERDDGGAGDPPLKKRYRTMKPTMTRIAKKYGSETWSSDMVALGVSGAAGATTGWFGNDGAIKAAGRRLCCAARSDGIISPGANNRSLRKSPGVETRSLRGLSTRVLLLLIVTAVGADKSPRPLRRAHQEE
jgi:hypothetical protein